MRNWDDGIATGTRDQREKYYHGQYQRRGKDLHGCGGKNKAGLGSKADAVLGRHIDPSGDIGSWSESVKGVAEYKRAQIQLRNKLLSEGRTGKDTHAFNWGRRTECGTPVEGGRQAGKQSEGEKLRADHLKVCGIETLI